MSNKLSYSILLSLLITILFLTLVVAQNIEIKTDKNIYQQGEIIKYTIQLYDNSNNPISGNMNVIFEDATSMNKIKRTVPANIEQEINLGENALFGYWKITAKENTSNKEVARIITIESNERARFELNNNELTITNIGNMEYSRTIQISIGDAIETKEVSLNVLESTKLKLIAPEGTYNIQVSDGKTTLSRQNVQLTGNAVAILSNEQQGTTITGINHPGENQNQTLGDILNKSKLALAFIFAFLVLFILVVVQRVRENRPKKTKRR